MHALRVRAYNVRFGDAILVSVPDTDEGGTTTTRHILFDVGNALSSAGGHDDVFEPIVADVLNELDGSPLDLYVSTHEHLDHVQGLFYASHEHGRDLDISRIWMTASAENGYYERPGHEEAKKRNKKLTETLRGIADGLPLTLRTEPSIDFLLLNNGIVPDALAASNPTRSTKKCVDFLKEHPGEHSYVSRRNGPKRIASWPHPCDELWIEVWAPEEDTSSYHGRFTPNAFAAVGASGLASGARSSELVPPPGVDAGAFYDLIRHRQNGFYDNLLAIDKANNNTSVVVCLEWRGWRLLFPGDAEQRSWKEMSKRKNVLKPVHFLKMGHHGSHNATPDGDIFDTILPAASHDGRQRVALVSTADEPYPSVPDEEPSGAMARIKNRVDHLCDTRDIAPGKSYNISFPADGSAPMLATT
ncbi:MAG: hypothetical protein GY720_16025 [bacterium]|nr:hypothetical protein [bacterium]